MKHSIIVILSLFMASCSFRPLYAPLGAVVGGAAGSIAGPMGAGLGAGAGSAAGSLLAGNDELEDAKEEIKALSTGDVNKLVQMRLEEAKEGGFFDSILDGVYSFVKLVLLGVVLWQVVPIAITWMSHKKLKAQNGTISKT